MISEANSPQAALRQYIYTLLLIVTAAITTGRIVGVENVLDPSGYKNSDRKWPAERPEPSPTFSSNDRSRWATVRSLVENGTFVIGRRDNPALAEGYNDTGILFEPGYRSIDVMMNPSTGEFYSTKPPLLTCLVAGEYWLLKHTLGWNLADQTWPVVCTILITFNLIPLLIALHLLSKLIEEYGRSDWGRLYTFTAACFGTFLTTFAVTLNNHTPAACCVLFALYPLLRGRSAHPAKPFSLREILCAGFFAGLAAGFDLPAASFTAAVSVVVLFQAAYHFFAHLRSMARESSESLPAAAIHTRAVLQAQVLVVAAALPAAALLLCNYLAIGELTPAYDKFGTVWYEYPGSHWLKAKIESNPHGIDFAREPKSVYAFHLLLGHHGLFSLTPIWLLALGGMLCFSRRAVPIALRYGFGFSIPITLVVIGFYIYKTNNYGGWTSGPRWQFWFTPLFLLGLIPAADALGSSSWGRRIAGFALAVSVFSAAYPVFNPWRHPWPYQLCEYLGWLKY